jgi:hypothetical protein
VHGVTVPAHVGASQKQPLSDAHSVSVVFALHDVNVPVQTTGHEQYSVTSHDPCVVKSAHDDGVPLHPVVPHVQPASVHTVSPYRSPMVKQAGSVPSQGPAICPHPGQYVLTSRQSSVGHAAHVENSGLPLQPGMLPATQSGHSSALQANCDSHSSHVEAVAVPTQLPAPVSIEHPGQVHACRSSKQLAHVLSSVAPEHVGVTAKSTGGDGSATVGALQQIWS